MLSLFSYPSWILKINYFITIDFDGFLLVLLVLCVWDLNSKNAHIKIAQTWTKAFAFNKVAFEMQLNRNDSFDERLKMLTNAPTTCNGDLMLTHACDCFGGWSGAMDAGWRDRSGIPPARRIPDGVLDSCINGIFDDALSLDRINSRSIW